MESTAEIDSDDSTDYAAARDEGSAKEGTERLKSTNTADSLKSIHNDLSDETSISKPQPLAPPAEKVDATAIKVTVDVETVPAVEEASVVHVTELQRPCMECSQRNVQCYCVTCDTEICDDCNRTIHSPRTLAGHERLPISLRPSPPLMCKVHEGEAVKLFCTEAKCREPVCVLCGFGAHKNHNCCVIEDVVSLEKKSLKTHLAGCDKKLAQLRKRNADIDGAEAALRAHHATVTLHLKEDFNAARIVLKWREATLTSKLDAHVEKRIKEFQKLQSETNEQLNALTSAAERARQASDESGLDFLSLVDEADRQVQSRLATAGKALSAYKVVPSDELEYNLDNKRPVENYVGSCVAALLFNSYRPSLNTVLRKPSVGEDLIVSGTVVLDPILTAGDQAVVPLKYESITVKKGGVLTVRGWEGLEKKGGVLVLIIAGYLLIEEGGSIDVSGKGFRGGACYERSKGKAKTNMSQTTSVGLQGESSQGIGTLGMANNGGGGGGGGSYDRICYGGSGGGFGSAGEAGIPLFTDSGANRFSGQYQYNYSYDGLYPKHYTESAPKGGSIYGRESLDDVDMLHHKLIGSGGGSGFKFFGRSGDMGPAGGNGGGSLLIRAECLFNYGEILSNGADGCCEEEASSRETVGGGGGSGGAIKIVADEIQERGKIQAVGGKGGLTHDDNGKDARRGGLGGLGRVRIDGC